MSTIKRKLATVRKVSAIEPITGADLIELAHIDGWQCVVKKDQFKPGELGVYFEVDSFLNLSDSRYAFLAKNKITWFGKEGVRIRTMTLRGALSQGLLMPLADFPEALQAFHKTRLYDPNEHDQHFDVTDLLGIEKWEAPIPAELNGLVAGGFPSLIPKTDEDRIQNFPSFLEKYADTEFECSVKLDGTSMTVYHFDGREGVCGRNWEFLPESTDTLSRVARESRLLTVIHKFGPLAFQGELVGPGINGNPGKFLKHKFCIFNVYDIDKQRYLTPVQRTLVVSDLLKEVDCDMIDHVPSNIWRTQHVVGTRLGEFKSVQDLLDFADQYDGEGFVFKAMEPDQYGRIISFKVISNRYLLKHGG